MIMDNRLKRSQLLTKTSVIQPESKNSATSAKSKTSDEQALNKLLLDTACFNDLDEWANQFNLFDVLKITRNEIRHSNVLSWLLDPNANHGLGDAFLKQILAAIVSNNGDKNYDVTRLMLADFRKFTVQREQDNIDILLSSTDDKIVIAIENKVGAHEHSNQLNRYRTIIDENYSNKYQKIFVFLTPDKMDPSDSENWGILSYEDVMLALEHILKTMDIKPDIRLVIDNYYKIIRRKIVEDPKLVKICNDIYNKHKQALDLIFEYRVDAVETAMMKALRELEKEGKIEINHSQHGQSLSFHTPTMTEVLPYIGPRKGSWGNGYNYIYWIRIDRDKNRIKGWFEIGGDDVPNETMVKMRQIEKICTNKKREQFKYYRMFDKTVAVDFDELDESGELAERVEQVTKRLLEDMLKKEAELIKKIA